MDVAGALQLPPPVLIDAAAIGSVLTYKSLISHLRSFLPSLSATLHSPLRHSHSLSTPTATASASLLLMPSWSSSPLLPYLGVKLVTHFPLNSHLHLPTVHASYSLFSSATGAPLASLDGTHLTLRRTAAVSALASSYLSAPSARVLVMVGAGSLAPHLIRAHLVARPTLARVHIWNRSPAKARALAAELAAEIPEAEFTGVDCLEEAVRLGDVVSCATNSEAALVRGASLKAGAHLDLVGSFTAAMRECDDEAIRRGRVFVDTWAAVEEAGELIGAMERGVITREGIVGDLVGLIGGEREGRRGPEEITVFKSVGSAAVDILSAQLVYEVYMKQKLEGRL